MPLSDYDFHLPQEHIAQVPADRREESRLLVLNRSAPELTLDRFHRIGRYLCSGDLLVLNDTRVFPARLRGRRRCTAVAMAPVLGHGHPANVEEEPGKKE